MASSYSASPSSHHYIARRGSITAPAPYTIPPPSSQRAVYPYRQGSLSYSHNNNSASTDGTSSSVPSLSRDFVVRRISEGESGRSKEESKCEACGKGYKHISSLAKHLWEHTPEWNVTKKLLISKHQQVQSLEAASILISMNDKGDGNSESNPSSDNEEEEEDEEEVNDVNAVTEPDLVGSKNSPFPSSLPTLTGRGMNGFLDSPKRGIHPSAGIKREAKVREKDRKEGRDKRVIKEDRNEENVMEREEREENDETDQGVFGEMD